MWMKLLDTVLEIFPRLAGLEKKMKNLQEDYKELSEAVSGLNEGLNLIKQMHEEMAEEIGQLNKNSDVDLDSVTARVNDISTALNALRPVETGGESENTLPSGQVEAAMSEAQSPVEPTETQSAVTPEGAPNGDEAVGTEVIGESNGITRPTTL